MTAELEFMRGATQYSRTEVAPRIHFGRNCDCCAHIFDGRNRGVPADYLWTGANGYDIALCARCCVLWRSNGAEDPALAPVRIRQIERAQVFTAAPGADPSAPEAWTPIGTTGEIKFEWKL